MIPGVELIPLVTHNDERGFFREILKSNQITKFGQWSMSYMHQGVVKAFHIHAKQWDYWVCVSGVIKAVVCDLRWVDNWSDLENWKYLKEIDLTHECYGYILGDNQKPHVLVIPPGVAHGLKVLQGPAVLMYVTSEMYNPKDEGRIPFDALGYDWHKETIK